MFPRLTRLALVPLLAGSSIACFSAASVASESHSLDYQVQVSSRIQVRELRSAWPGVWFDGGLKLGELPMPKVPLTLEWTSQDGSQHRVEVPIAELSRGHRIRGAKFYVTVEASSVEVGMEEDEEPRLAQTLRCLGSGFSASGQCSTNTGKLRLLASIPTPPTAVKLEDTGTR